MIARRETIAFFPKVDATEGHSSSPLSGGAMDRRISARPPWLRRGVLLAVAMVLIVGMALFYARSVRDGVVVDRSVVMTAPVRSEAFRDFVPLRGQVAPRTTVFVTALQGGQVRRLIATDGMMVTAGQPLAQIFNPQFLVAVTSQEAEITSRLGDISARGLALQRGQRDLEQAIAATEQALADAEDEYDRQKILFDKGIVSQSRLDPLDKKRRYYRERLATIRESAGGETATATRERKRIARAEYQLDANLATVRSTRDALVLRAPAAGRLTNFRLQSGQTVASGDNLGQVDSEGAYKLQADVDEFYLDRLSTGQFATAHLGTTDYRLVVTKVERQVTNGRFKVELAFTDPPPAGLRRGQSIDLQLKLGEAVPALTLPTGAWARGTGPTLVFVLEGRNRARRRTVLLGRSNSEQVEIVRGLAVGEQVIVSDTTPYAKYETMVLQ